MSTPQASPKCSAVCPPSGPDALSPSCPLGPNRLDRRAMYIQTGRPMAKAPNTEDDAPKKKRRGASVMAWVLMAMIIGGLGGFGVTNFGGGITTIGTVGDREIDGERLRPRAATADERLLAADRPTDRLCAGAGAWVWTVRCCKAWSTAPHWTMKPTASACRWAMPQWRPKSRPISAFQGVAGGFDRDTYRQTLQQQQPDRSRVRIRPARRYGPADPARHRHRRLYRARGADRHAGQLGRRRAQLFHAAADRGRSDHPPARRRPTPI